MYSDNVLTDKFQLILESIDLILERAAAIHCPNDFLVSREGMLIFDACVLRLQVIGETVKKLMDHPAKPLLPYSRVPWNAIVSMRNLISHEYANIDEEIVFSVIRDDLPLLREVISSLLSRWR